jgi:MFS family permease
MTSKQYPLGIQSTAKSTRALARLVALFSASGVALMGNSVTQVALPWFVITTGGSAAETGLVAFMGALPLVIGALLGGTVVDRLGYRRAGVLSDLLSFVTVALIPLLYITIGLPLWLLLVLVFCGALLDAPGATARQALLPRMSAAAGVSLERTNAIYETTEGLVFLLGPIIAGLLIALLGPVNAIWFNAATFVVSAVLTGLVRAPAEQAVAETQTSYREQFSAGLRFIWNDQLVRVLIGLSSMFMALLAPLYGIILPIYVEQTRANAVDLGLLLGMHGGGSIIGALGYAALGLRLPRRALLISCLIAMGIGYGVLASLPPWPLLLLTSFLQGVVNGPINPLINTVIQQRTPETMRGRVLGLMTGLGLCAAPIGLLGAGLVIESIGIQASMAAIAACVAALALLTPFVRSLRQLEA